MYNSNTIQFTNQLYISISISIRSQAVVALAEEMNIYKELMYRVQTHQLVFNKGFEVQT